MEEIDSLKFSLFSPTDYRYAVDDLKPYLTEEAFIKYKLKVEVALLEVLVKKKICPKSVLDEVKKAINFITAKEVYEEEKRIKHDIRALVNCIRNKVSDKAKPFIHFSATSFDIVDTANSLRYKDATEKVILPYMITLERTWIELAEKYKDTVQIGRTHGQHADPITFGFAVALYVQRLGDRILKLKEANNNLKGKFSGAVGAYNALSLFFDNPQEVENEILAKLGLLPSPISSQILPSEPLTDFIHSIISAFGVLANFSDDMRNLQRSEISEVTEAVTETQVGSSTMPQKRNPINFENVKSMYKAFMPRMITVYLDQISEHQRDLTNSCSQRYIPELLVAFASSIKRLINVSNKLQVDKINISKNFKSSQDVIIAEPLYIILASLGHPDAHEYVRRKTSEALKTKSSLYKIVEEDKEIKSYLDKFTPIQKQILKDPSRYIGIAEQKVEKICQFWKKHLDIK